jgi:hypothetical protein
MRLRACQDLQDLLFTPEQRSLPRDDRGYELERMLRLAISALGNGDFGGAAVMLFGAEEEGRGLLLKDRRRLAARELGIQPTTFRQDYERAVIEDLAVELIRPPTGR